MQNYINFFEYNIFFKKILKKLFFNIKNKLDIIVFLVINCFV